ncbi:MAG: S26 family signal peptidase [Oscillospiraceae bacterium]|nr:S26 family signal peptidase [Oscillospiraceae bacterium]MCL2277903.1 S26 family signal peptidase [Oscillospiraceae bacterium]
MKSNDVTDVFNKNKQHVIFLFSSIIFLMFFRTFAFDNIVIFGESMHPTFCSGDVIIFQKFSLNNAQLGDIVIANIDGKLLVKRVTYISYFNELRKFFITGDNYNLSFDSKDFGFICSTQIVGIAVLRVFPFRSFGRIL